VLSNKTRLFPVFWKCLKIYVMLIILISGEKVLCYHGPLLYEAKCLEHRVNEKVIEFKVHYAGWNKRYLMKLSQMPEINRLCFLKLG